MNEPQFSCAIPRQQVFPQHADYNARMHEARWRSKQVADSVKGQRRHGIGMSRFVQPGDVPVEELSARSTSTYGLGNAQVVADRNGPGNLNDFGCPTKKGLCQRQVAKIGS